MKIIKIKTFKGFTLVELIIVITILAILATIAFISFQKYTKDARDGNRLVTIQSINEGLSMHNIKTGNFPVPDYITGTGQIDGRELIKVGTIAEDITKIINMNKVPLDPLFGTPYVYGLSNDGKYYQLASIYENIQANTLFTEKVYADSYNAHVIGNYKGIIKYNSGVLCIANVPSLIFNATGSVNLMSNDIGYIVHKQINIPYKTNINFQQINKSTQEIMQSISNTGSVTYECGINQENWNTKKLELEALFGYDVDRIGQVVFGEKYYTEINPNGNSGGGAEEININNVTYECNGLVGSANPDQRGDDYGYPDFDLCTNTIVLNSLLNIPTSSTLTDNPGEREVYAFVLEQGKHYTLESFGDDTDSDTVFFLFDNQGNKLAMNDDIDDSIHRSSIDFTPNYTGYYFLGVMGYDDGGTYADYTLDISEGGGPKLVNGLCGSDTGKSLVVAPVNLCNKGTSSIVVDEGEGLNFTWTCDGLNGGTNASCSATHKIPPVCNYQQADIDALNVAGANGDFEIRDEYYTQLTAFPLTKPQWCSVVNLTWLGGATVTPEIYTLNLLKGLILNNNGITSLPAEIGNLTNLEYLEGYNNQLTSLPSQIGNLTYLTNLNFSRNQLTSLPSQIGNLTLLTGLSLSTNQLTTLPPEIGNLTNLMNISLGYNQLSSLPLEIGNLVKLTSLDLSSNLLTNLPTQIANLTNLTTLYYDSNQVVTIPSSIFSLTNLQTLYMRSNLIVTIPPGIGDLVNLTTIDFEGNKITGIPSTFGNLAKLSYLRIRNNKISALPVEFFNLSSLTTLYIETNLLSTLPPEIGNLTSLRSLYLDANPLTNIPPEIGNLTNLQVLYLRNNQLTTLPAEFSNMTSLGTLHYGANPGTTVPNAIFNLPNLVNLGLLDISQVTSISSEIANLTNLKSLSFRRASHLPTVPPEIGNLPKLERLYFGNSAITSLPSEIGNIATLKTFILYNTQLTTLPEGMKNFSNLTSLNISGTPGIGQLNKNFGVNTPNSSQINIPVAGKTMTIGGDGTKIVISVSP